MRELAGYQLIFVGDYVNRGPESRRTLEQLIKLQLDDPETVFLRGNHEAALLAFLDGQMPFYEFAGLGGIPTLKAYLSKRVIGDVRREFVEAFPESHRALLESCHEYFETDDLVVSHCGINPLNPSSRATADMVLDRHPELFAAEFNSSKLVVCGHYVQTSGLPFVRNDIVCVDTGCGTATGPLTAFLIPDRTILQR